MHTPIESLKLEVAEQAAIPFLRAVEDALEEAQENVRKLQAVRTAIKTELMGENLQGLQKAMDNAGMGTKDDKKASTANADKP